MSGWSSDDATPVPGDDPDRPLRPRRADGQQAPEQYTHDQYAPADPHPHDGGYPKQDETQYVDPYAAQREAEYVAQHETRPRRARAARQSPGAPAAPQPPAPQQPADAWWNQPPAEQPRRRRRPRPQPSQYAQEIVQDPGYAQAPHDADQAPHDSAQAPHDAAQAPAEPTRPMVREGRRARQQQPEPPAVAPSDPTVRVRPYRPEQARHQEGPLQGTGRNGQGGYEYLATDDGYGDRQYDEPYDQSQDDYAQGGGHGGSSGASSGLGGQPGDDYDDDQFDDGEYDEDYDPDTGGQPYFHPLDPETPVPQNRRGWRSSPTPTPDSPYDLSGIDQSELTGSLSLLGLEGPAGASDITRPIEPIRAPIARAPRRPLPPVAPPARPYDDRGYAEPEYDEVEEYPEYDEPETAKEKAASSRASLLGSSALMAAGTMASRLLGFVRASVLVAAVTAGSDAAEAFSVANIMPNALYILLAGGVLNAVLVPQIARAAKQKDGGEDYINRLLTAALALLAVVTVAVIVASPLLIKVYGSNDWPPDLVTLASAFSLYCLPQVFFYGLYTLLGQVLNARGHFGAFMWSPVANNVVSIIGLVAFIAVFGGGSQPVGEWSAGMIMLLAGSQTLGVAAQAIVLIPILKRAGIRFRPKFGLRGVGLASASRVAGWTFAAVVVQQVAFVVISKVTTTAQNLTNDRPEALIKTGKSVYDNALLLFMLPHSLVAVSLVTALFTSMSNAAAENRIRDVRADLSLGLRLTGLATAVSTAAILALGPDIARSMFPSARSVETNGIAYVVMAMSLGLIPYSAQYLFQRVFYAFEDAKTPFFIQVATSGTWAVGNMISLFVLRDTRPEYIVIGVGVSMAASNFVSAFLAYTILRRRFGDLDGHQVMRTHVELILVAAVGGVVAWLLGQCIHIFLGDAWAINIIATVVGGLVLIAIYIAGLRQLGVKEIEDVAGPLLRRLPSSPATVARHSTH
ncbi:murein biosynthesis integral membrane protein MurJ [Kineosporia succinea]|uniref:Murein biosynthesis integral membrane protein MurJ n=1 Tax=Kineosporia succinea TaxID=84632 RepID=A0ABT9P1U1_9ACTN|nr:murein biosynthesis integral membrane protein MurJ [Kineosporia succinea]MDP9826394.1 murein biosynthesis integral membrane protein MurJ [Kineosporia succinea]